MEKNTTYTVKRLTDKGVVKRQDPAICIPLITKDKVQDIETQVLLDKFLIVLCQTFVEYLSVKN